MQRRERLRQRYADGETSDRSHGQSSYGAASVTGAGLPPGVHLRIVTGYVDGVIGRIPILDVQPVVECGRRPAKAVAGETFQVSATVIRGPRRARRRRGAARSGGQARPAGPDARARAGHGPVRRGRDRHQRGHLVLPRRVVVRSDRALGARRGHQDPARPGRRADAGRGGAAVRAGRAVDQAAAGRRPARRGAHRAQRARQEAPRPQPAALGPAGGGAGAAGHRAPRASTRCATW